MTESIIIYITFYKYITFFLVYFAIDINIYILQMRILYTELHKSFLSSTENSLSNILYIINVQFKDHRSHDER